MVPSDASIAPLIDPKNKTHQKRDKVRAILLKINIEKPSFLPEVLRP